MEFLPELPTIPNSTIPIFLLIEAKIRNCEVFFAFQSLRCPLFILDYGDGKEIYIDPSDLEDGSSRASL